MKYFICQGNDGAGVYVMSAASLIQLNQIYSNNDIGVSFVGDEVELSSS